tara:strand:- start:325 stop:507 length:183 start_codon:yes stop_codon:yes gene_type:complete
MVENKIDNGKILIRKYVYASTFLKILTWGVKSVEGGLIRQPPNHKENFPYYLEQYLMIKK